MRRAIYVLSLVLLVSPLLVSAKTSKLKGFERDKGKEISVSEPLGWPISITTDSRVEATLESFPGMAVIRMSVYRPWWQIFGNTSATSTVTISGLPKLKLLHIYNQGYRIHTSATSTSIGTLTLPFRSEPGDQFIIKDRPSTYHINLNGNIWNLLAKGGDCSAIGTWNDTTRTCTLTGDVGNNPGLSGHTIAIEDNGITLNGGGKTVRGDNTGDGVYTDKSDVHVTNIEVHNFARGIVYQDSLFTFASGGLVDKSVMADNILNLYDEGVSSLKITDNDIVVAQTGVSLVDQFDGFPTDGIVITRNSFKQNNNDFFNSGTSFVLNTATDRGNWWQRNGTCTQDTTNPNYCTNSYNEGDGTDATPWTCEIAWRAGITCPTSGGGGGGGTTTPPVGTVIDQAIANAESLLGTRYQWGGKGFDYSSAVFATVSKIKTDGYKYYNDTLKRTTTGTGIDCSGLVMWSFDEVQNAGNKVVWGDCLATVGQPDSGKCVIAYEGAAGQLSYNVDVISSTNINRGDLLFFDTPERAGIDHVAIYMGGSSQNVIHANGHTDSVAYGGYDPVTNKLTTVNSGGAKSILTPFKIGRIKKARIELVINSESPVYLIVTDPDGFVVSPDNPWEGPMEYQVHDLYDSGELNDIVLTGNRKIGEYKVQVVPKPGAQPTETYSVVARANINGAWQVIDLARNIPISDISQKAYVMTSSSRGIMATNEGQNKTKICHVPPGNPQNAQTLSLPQSAVRAHIAHGDYLGECKALSTATVATPSSTESKKHKK
ncbi:MAG TPA: NlpC/P60 family protein [Candidatus Paceibacterota bacterium]